MSRPMKNVGGYATAQQQQQEGPPVAISGNIDTILEKSTSSSGIFNTILVKLCSAIFFGLMFSYTVVIIFGETWFLPPEYSEWCHAAQQGYPDAIRQYPNPDSNNNPCYYERTLYLLWMNQFEATFSRRMIVSVVLGAAIGFERKAADRPAGVRTMTLVSLGSCFFTMCGQHAFRSSPQEFDAARVSAAIPSGVGFLGSALIWKHSKGRLGEGHEVHGLTTAASVWLSASIGIGSGGGLFLLSAYATALVIFVLRIGPRIFFADDASSMDEEEWETEGWESTDADEKEEEEDAPLTREEQRQMLEEQTSGRPSLVPVHDSFHHSVRNGGLTRRKSRKSMVTFGS